MACASTGATIYIVDFLRERKVEKFKDAVRIGDSAYVHRAFADAWTRERLQKETKTLIQDMHAYNVAFHAPVVDALLKSAPLEVIEGTCGTNWRNPKSVAHVFNAVGKKIVRRTHSFRHDDPEHDRRTYEVVASVVRNAVPSVLDSNSVKGFCALNDLTRKIHGVGVLDIVGRDMFLINCVTGHHNSILYHLMHEKDGVVRRALEANSTLLHLVLSLAVACANSAALAQLMLLPNGCAFLKDPVLLQDALDVLVSGLVKEDGLASVLAVRGLRALGKHAWARPMLQERADKSEDVFVKAVLLAPADDDGILTAVQIHATGFWWPPLAFEAFVRKMTPENLRQQVKSGTVFSDEMWGVALVFAARRGDTNLVGCITAMHQRFADADIVNAAAAATINNHWAIVKQLREACAGKQRRLVERTGFVKFRAKYARYCGIGAVKAAPDDEQYWLDCCCLDWAKEWSHAEKVQGAALVLATMTMDGISGFRDQREAATDVFEWMHRLNEPHHASQQTQAKKMFPAGTCDMLTS